MGAMGRSNRFLSTVQRRGMRIPAPRKSPQPARLSDRHSRYTDIIRDGSVAWSDFLIGRIGTVYHQRKANTCGVIGRGNTGGEEMAYEVARSPNQRVPLRGSGTEVVVLGSTPTS